jgi:hypothetical protein
MGRISLGLGTARRAPTKKYLFEGDLVLHPLGKYAKEIAAIPIYGSGWIHVRRGRQALSLMKI